MAERRSSLEALASADELHLWRFLSFINIDQLRSTVLDLSHFLDAFFSTLLSLILIPASHKKLQCKAYCSQLHKVDDTMWHNVDGYHNIPLCWSILSCNSSIYDRGSAWTNSATQDTSFGKKLVSFSLHFFVSFILLHICLLRVSSGVSPNLR